MAGFEPAVVAPPSIPARAWTLAFHERRLLAHEGRVGERLIPVWSALPAELRSSVVRWQLVGRLDGRAIVSAELAAGTSAPDGLALRGLRGLFGQLPDDFFWIVARAVQIVDWDRDHQFCSRCGTRTQGQTGERSKRCPSCGLTSYPRLAPAVIVLIHRGDEMLLARSPQFPPGMFSTLAGFVEPGETLEETVVREVHEEVGVTLGEIRYFGSQPWPFPHSLMVGFTAAWAEGEIVLDRSADEPEIEDAGWFRADNLPLVPPRISIARALIDDFVARG